MGLAGRYLAPHGRRADLDRRPPLLPASWYRLAAHGICGIAHVRRRPPGWFDDHPATRAQPLSGRNRPRADAHAQSERSDHRAEDRGGLQQGPDSRNVSEHGAVSLQRVRYRNGFAHVLRKIGGSTGYSGKRYANRHAEGQQLLQPGVEPRSRARTPQYGARADGQIRPSLTDDLRNTEPQAAAR